MGSSNTTANQRRVKVDMILLSVVKQDKDENGKFTQFVNIHHDGDRGNGDPNESFFATSARGLPGGNIPWMTLTEFVDVAERTYPWLNTQVKRQFYHAKKIHDTKMVANLTGIRKVTADFLRKALDLVTA